MWIEIKSERTKTLLAIVIVLSAEAVFAFLFKHTYFAMKPRATWSNFQYFMLLLQQFATVLSFIFIIRLFKLPLSPLRSRNEGVATFLKTPLVSLCVACTTVVAVGATAYALRKMAGYTPGAPSPVETYQNNLSTNGPAYMAVLIGLLVAPFKEELMCRAFLAQQIRKVVPVMAAIALSSIAFASLHWPTLDLPTLKEFLLLDFIPLVLVSFVLGLTFFTYGFTASVLVHFFFNAKGYVFNYMTDYPLIFTFLSLLGVGFLISMFITQIRGTRT